MNIAIVGTRGIPARYGGFETLADQLSKRLVERGHTVTVYCRKPFTSPDDVFDSRTVFRLAKRNAVYQHILVRDVFGSLSEAFELAGRFYALLQDRLGFDVLHWRERREIVVWLRWVEGLHAPKFSPIWCMFRAYAPR